jgi:predicted nucleic acid-binding protein
MEWKSISNALRQDIQMILVDTSVWIDFFADRSTTGVLLLESFISDHEDICICGLILTEILQGIKDDGEYLKTKNLFRELRYLGFSDESFYSAAEIYRKIRSKGITIRNTVDCLIAAVAIENNARLLHNDRDFDFIAQHFPLRIIIP